MAVQYNKLFKMMIDRKMTNNQLAMVKPCQFSIRYSNKLRNFMIQKLVRKSRLDLELM